MHQRTRRRVATVALAPCAATATWGAARLLGIDLVASRGDGARAVGPVDVLAAALLAALAACLVVRVLERRSRYPRRTWARVGSTALAISIIGPSWLADGASAVALMAMHVMTASVVIVGLSGTLPLRRTRPALANTLARDGEPVAPPV